MKILMVKTIVCTLPVMVVVAFFVPAAAMILAGEIAVLAIFNVHTLLNQ